MKIKSKIAAAFAAVAVSAAALAGAATASADQPVLNNHKDKCINEVTAAGHKVFPQQPCLRYGHKHNSHHNR